MMNRRAALLILAAGLTTPALPARAQAIGLDVLSRYLNGLTTAEAGFTQVNADGSRAGGTVYIRRPGRMRFEYDPPERSLVIAGGGQVAIFDGKSNQGPQQYPLSRTPLNLILADRIDLSRARMVVAHGARGPDTVIVAQDPDRPDYGTLELVFAPGPVLRGWTVTDGTGQRTEVTLGALRVGETYPPSLFSATIERDRRR